MKAQEATRKCISIAGNVTSLANEFGVHETTIYRWEQGKVQPGQAAVKKIAHYLLFKGNIKVDLYDLMG